MAPTVSTAIIITVCRRRGLGRHPLDQARQARDRKPLNSADATYDMAMSGVYARNVAFEPSSRRRAVNAGDDDDSVGGATELVDGATTTTRNNDNEYEYVWDASAVAARTPRPGQLHRAGKKTTETGSSSVSTSFGGRPSDQCRCMTEPTRTLPRQVSTSSAVDSSTRGGARHEKPAAAPTSLSSRHRGADSAAAAGGKTATLGRFGHLESRSAARSAGGPQGKGQSRQGRVDDPPRRVCPYCGHQSSSTATPADGAACGAGTPSARLDTSLTLPRRQQNVAHRRA